MNVQETQKFEYERKNVTFKTNQVTLLLHFTSQ